MFRANRVGIVFRFGRGPGVRLLLGSHKPLYTERHRKGVHAWHTKPFCVAYLAPLKRLAGTPA